MTPVRLSDDQDGRVLERIETYYDTVPRSTAEVEDIGPFTLFVAAGGGFPFYARPRLGHPEVATVADVDGVRARQRALGVPEAFEWTDDLHPGLAEVVGRSGLTVTRHPLMARSTGSTPPAGAPAGASVEVPAGISVRMLEADDRALAATRATVGVGFKTPGTAVGPDGAEARDRMTVAHDPVHAETRRRIRQGLFALAVAEDGWGPVAGGGHAPRDGVSEITGVATLPAYRRQGLAAAVTAALVAHATSVGVDLCFLSADSEAVARVYARIGFAAVGTTCTTEPGEV
jgi:GNAT superfamily N-acetyltransferase